MATVKKITKVIKEKPVKTRISKVATKISKPEVHEELNSNKGIRAAVLGVDGKAAGSVTLPPEYFGAKINKQLMAQAVRVYQANQRVGHAATKTRGMVEGSTRKIYKQKGTGRARHGAIRAPIFVGGGIVFGPMPRDYSLKLPPKLKRAAVASALSSQLSAGNIIFVSGLSDVKPKTKVMAQALTAVGRSKNTLLVVPKDVDMVVRAARNIAGVDVVPVTDMHAYGVVTHGKIIFMKEAVSALRK
jgi:large subunit ribosomal protein L4